MAKRSVVAILLSAAALQSTLLPAAEPAGCLAPGTWAVPAGAKTVAVTPDTVAAAARNAQFVLLGEAHDNADHHRWQLHALGMLLAQRGKLALGFEMFPRRVQPVLDRWVAGKLTEQELLRDADWGTVWGFEPKMYMPLFQFARLHRAPMIALNVERSLLREVGKIGWAAIPSASREGVGDPAPATQAYRDRLKQVYAMHSQPEDSDKETFEHFVEGQLLWDRAFAEGLNDAARKHPDALVVGIIGSGHLSDSNGVPYQLRALGAERIVEWLPVAVETPCNELTEGGATAVFAVEDARTVPPQRLGIMIEDEAAGPRVREVLSGSVAENAGMQQGDRVIAAAGDKVSNSSDLIAVVRRQAPGTWLPLKIVRAGREIDLVAKFPPQP
jgi:uncharacterized iron-regulated protein